MGAFRGTPGPWVEAADFRPTPARKMARRTVLNAYSGGRDVEVAILWMRNHSDEALSNARVIAAAPELVAALGAIVGCWDRGDDGTIPNALIVRARAALGSAGVLP